MTHTNLPPSDYKHYVYRHIRLDNNMPFYIGVGTVSKYGMYTRAFSLKRNIVWHRITEKTSYKVEIIYETDDYDEALIKECEFISLYGRYNTSSSGSLCNLTDGGEGTKNVVVSKETREKFRLRQLGSKVSASVLANMSASQLRRYKNRGISPRARTVYQYTLEGLLVQEWESCTHVKRLWGLTSEKVSTALKKGTYYAHGFFWSYEFKPFFRKPEKQNYFRRGVIIQEDLLGNVVNTFSSIKKASLFNNGNRGWVNGIGECCKGVLITFKNYKWKYEA